ncbi:MAG: DUF4347 domain-containing protein [Jaaginema sp. PMC 1079.18]|nr:DUF4347 domain-containing protein [Jaaginema sp. PMC 1080.18]MEC4851667.1 DUF4347 domain-containing protein [Jaaginema sp. PMC 1079.18]MEC4868339.1 DUF4347 domain-containing protein [Jaaginema sp. PMC 1078.18]
MSHPVLTHRPVELNHSAGKPKMLVAIDTRVADYHYLARGMQDGSSVLLLDPKQDGITQISRALSKIGNLTSLHLISHGEPGCLYLGNTQLKLDNLHHYTAELQQWQQHCQNSVFELLLYGCEVAQGIGQQFIERLSDLIQAPIAASRTRTGNASLGGDWQLEVTTGQIRSPLALRPEIMAAYGGVFATFTATSTTELINAINQANNEGVNPGQDIINLTAGVTYSFTSGIQILAGASNIARGIAALPKIFTSIVINGNGAIIERSTAAATDFRLFYIDGEPGFNGDLTLNNLTLQNGRASVLQDSGNDGGALWNSGTVTINSSTIQNNTATDDGGAIANFRTLTINNSSLLNNTAGSGASNSGGAIDSRSNLSPGIQAVVNINGTTISGNTAGEGGAIVSQFGTAATPSILNLDRSIIQNNTTQAGGATNNSSIVGLNEGTITRQNTLITGNNPNNDIFTDAATTARASDIEVRDGATPIVNGTTTAINLGTTPAGTAIGSKTFTIANISTGATGFQLDIDGITAPTGLTLSNVPTTIAVGATANFTVDVNVQDAGLIQGQIVITSNDGDNLQNPYNFAITATVEGPEINVFDPNGNPLPLSGSFNFGQLAPGSTLAFTISNSGTQPLLLSNLRLPNGLQLLGTFPSTINAGATAQLQLQVVPDFQGAVTGAIQFDTNDFNEANYTFNLSGTVQPTGGSGGGNPQLTVDGNNIFTITAGNLKYTLSGTNTNLINEIGLYKVSSNGAIGNLQPGSADYLNAALQNSQVLFSALRSGDRPNEFTANLQNGILDLNNGDQFAFYLIRGGTKEAVQAGLPPGGQVLLGSPGGALQVRDLGNGRFSLGFEDGSDRSFNDVVVQIEATAENVPLGVGPAQLQGQELLNFKSSAFPQFSAVNQVNSNFRVYREAAFNNLGGLYRVDDAQGTIDGVAPGQEGYAQAALGRRIETLILSVANQSVRVVPGLLEGNALYAPFLIANASVEEFLAQNPNNQAGAGPQMYFPYIAANPDNVDHFRLLGNNVFGAEDLPGGGDFDYNDLIIQGNFAPA